MHDRDDEQRQWVFRAHVMDRAGALTSIASAFSNEGVSIDTVVGHGIEKQAGVDGSVILTFCCSEAKKDIMVRKVRRLSKVTRLEEHPYDSQNLRKSAVVHTTRRLSPRDVAGDESFLTCEQIRTDPRGWVYFLAGSPNQLDPVLRKLLSDGVVTDIVYSVQSL